MEKLTRPAQQPPWHQAQLKDSVLQSGQPAASHPFIGSFGWLGSDKFCFYFFEGATANCL